MAPSRNSYKFLLVSTPSLIVIVFLTFIGLLISTSIEYHNDIRYYYQGVCFSYNVTSISPDIKNVNWLVTNSDFLNISINQDFKITRGTEGDDVFIDEYKDCWITDCFWKDFYNLDFCDKEFPIKFSDDKPGRIFLLTFCSIGIPFSFCFLFCIPLMITALKKEMNIIAPDPDEPAPAYENSETTNILENIAPVGGSYSENKI